MGAGEIRETLHFVRAFCAFRKDHMANEVRPLAHPADLITTWTEDGDGCWTKGEDEFSPILPVAVTLDENLVRKVAALKVQKHVFLGKDLRTRLLRFREGCIRGAFEPFVRNVVLHLAKKKLLREDSSIVDNNGETQCSDLIFDILYFGFWFARPRRATTNGEQTSF